MFYLNLFVSRDVPPILFPTTMCIWFEKTANENVIVLYKNNKFIQYGR